MLRILVNALRTGVVTIHYPADPQSPPDRFRGAPFLRSGSALPPPAICPAGALSESFEAEGRRIGVDLGRCVFCGRCAEGTFEAAVTIGREFELATRDRSALRIEVGEAPAGMSSQLSGVRRDRTDAADRIRQVLGRSLHLRHLDAGSCNACDWELTALLNPVYDVRRLGIDFVASPRHADGVVITGSLTRNLSTAVRRTVEAVPDPRLVIAVGACACSGGIVGQGYASGGGADTALPVDVYIPGCPPRPEALIFGILVAMGRRNERLSPQTA